MKTVKRLNIKSAREREREREVHFFYSQKDLGETNQNKKFIKFKIIKLTLRPFFTQTF